MSIVVKAIYKNGALNPEQPLPLAENERITITFEPHVEPQKVPHQPTYGLIGWTGDPEIVRRIALEPEFGVQESP